MLTEPLRGSYVSLPLLAWMAVRERDQTPLVMLALALLEPDQSRICGTLEVELPLYDDTEAATLAALERYGWAGAVWSLDDPPPLDNTELAEMLKGLLAQTTEKLRATLVFAPDPTTGDSMAQTVEVSRAKGRFLMPPLEVPLAPPNLELLETMRDLTRNFRFFFREEPSGCETVLPR